MSAPVGETFFGRKIPFIDLLGARAEAREKGKAVVSLQMHEDLRNSWGFAHGGVVVTLLDVCMGSAAVTVDPDALGIVTIDLSVSFLRSANGRLRAEGRVLRGGRSVVHCAGDVHDADGELVAKALGTFRLKKSSEASR
ncbi:MAG TPA: PaaI family thioesterase [Myxococcales bacterium]|nr:PaaI family thioesterase [Myxococcales bacterium]